MWILPLPLLPDWKTDWLIHFRRLHSTFPSFFPSSYLSLLLLIHSVSLLYFFKFFLSISICCCPLAVCLRKFAELVSGLFSWFVCVLWPHQTSCSSVHCHYCFSSTWPFAFLFFFLFSLLLVGLFAGWLVFLCLLFFILILFHLTECVVSRLLSLSLSLSLSALSFWMRRPNWFTLGRGGGWYMAWDGQVLGHICCFCCCCVYHQL